MKIQFTVGSCLRGFVVLRMIVRFCNGCNGNLEQPVLQLIIFIYFISVKKMKYTSPLGVVTEASWFCVLIGCLL